MELDWVQFCLMVNELAKKWGNRIKFVDDLTVAEIIPRNPPSLLHMIVEEEIHRYICCHESHEIEPAKVQGNDN